MRSLIRLARWNRMERKKCRENLPARQEEDCEHYACVWSRLGSSPRPEIQSSNDNLYMKCDKLSRKQKS